jgi:hypothetical protein
MKAHLDIVIVIDLRQSIVECNRQVGTALSLLSKTLMQGLEGLRRVFAWGRGTNDGDALVLVWQGQNRPSPTFDNRLLSRCGLEVLKDVATPVEVKFAEFLPSALDVAGQWHILVTIVHAETKPLSVAVDLAIFLFVQLV